MSTLKARKPQAGLSSKAIHDTPPKGANATFDAWFQAEKAGHFKEAERHCREMNRLHHVSMRILPSFKLGSDPDSSDRIYPPSPPAPEPITPMFPAFAGAEATR